MQIHVQYSAQIKKLAGCGNEAIEVEDGTSAQAAIKRLASEHGDALSRYLLDADGCLQRTVLAFVNDTQVRWDEERELRDGDQLVFMAAIAGGL